jgi:hypothetical protein
MSDMLNNLLDANLDDLADLPEFGTYPAGTHKVVIKFEEKTVNDHPCIELQMKAIETEELANPGVDQPLAVGAEGSVLFMLDNEFGQGKLKQVIKPLASVLGVSSLRAVIEGANGMEVSVVTRVRQNKDKTQSYTDISKVIC